MSGVIGGVGEGGGAVGGVGDAVLTGGKSRTKHAVAKTLSGQLWAVGCGAHAGLADATGDRGDPKVSIDILTTT